MLMFDIFGAAASVLAWLGEDPDLDASYVLDIVKNSGLVEGKMNENHLTHITLLTRPQVEDTTEDGWSRSLQRDCGTLNTE